MINRTHTYDAIGHVCKVEVEAIATVAMLVSGNPVKGGSKTRKKKKTPKVYTALTTTDKERNRWLKETENEHQMLEDSGSSKRHTWRERRAAAPP